MDIKEYLCQIKNLEVQAYELNCIRNTLQNKLEKLSNTTFEIKQKKVIEEYSVISREKKRVVDVLSVFVGICLLVIAGGCVLEVTIAEILVTLVFITLLLFVPTMAIVWNGYRKSKEKLMEDNQKIDAYNQEVQRKNSSNRKRLEEKVNFLRSQVFEVSKNCNQTQSSLKRLYSTDLIHPKYRNLIAVCSMFEYFDTGRCSSLTGHEGAYNIFENEIRLNLIINKMDMVIKNLEQLKENQYELYCVMSESHRKLNHISSNLNNILSVTNDVAESVALTEYNSRIAAQNTEVLKWIEIFDHM